MWRPLTVLGLLALLLVTVGAGGRTKTVEFGWTMTRLTDTQKWLRVTNTDPQNSIKLLAVRGVDFRITALKAVRASGAATPSCSVSTEATTFGVLFCNGDLPPDSSLILIFDVTGSGGNFQIAGSDTSDPSTLEYGPDTEAPAFLPTDATFTTAGTATSRVTFTSKGNAFGEVEVLPIGYQITKVLSLMPAGGSCDPEGAGIDCVVDLPVNGTGEVTFETSGAPAQPTAEVLLTGDDGVGDQYVTQTEGAPAKYDLAASAHPASLHFGIGQRLRSIPLSFSVENSKTAERSSMAASATVKLSGSSPRALFGSDVSCGAAKLTAPPLAPGKTKKLCTLTLKPPSAKAKRAGRIDVVFTVACTQSLELSCANNRARASIVVG